MRVMNRDFLFVKYVSQVVGDAWLSSLMRDVY